MTFIFECGILIIVKKVVDIMIKVYCEEDLTKSGVQKCLEKFSNQYKVLDYDIVAVRVDGIGSYISYTIFIRYQY